LQNDQIGSLFRSLKKEDSIQYKLRVEVLHQEEATRAKSVYETHPQPVPEEVPSRETMVNRMQTAYDKQPEEKKKPDNKLFESAINEEAPKQNDQYKNYDEVYAKYMKECRAKEDLEKELKRLQDTLKL